MRLSAELARLRVRSVRIVTALKAVLDSCYRRAIAGGPDCEEAGALMMCRQLSCHLQNWARRELSQGAGHAITADWQPDAQLLHDVR
jgi:hypothetical protein